MAAGGRWLTRPQPRWPQPRRRRRHGRKHLTRLVNSPTPSTFTRPLLWTRPAWRRTSGSTSVAPKLLQCGQVDDRVLHSERVFETLQLRDRAGSGAAGRPRSRASGCPARRRPWCLARRSCRLCRRCPGRPGRRALVEPGAGVKLVDSSLAATCLGLVVIVGIDLD